METKNQATIEEMQELRIGSDFTFSCHKGVACFNTCCADVTILLTPYDVVRMRNALGMGSGEFLKKYTTVIRHEKSLFPLVVLTMKDDEKKQCHFVTPEGCQIYENRPWSCRMFPLDKKAQTPEGTIFGVIRKPGCLGFDEDRSIKVEDYLHQQGIKVFEGYEGLYHDIIENDRAKALDITNTDIYQMIVMSLYDLDTLKRFIFESSFLNKFKIEEARVETVRNDDVELLLFGMDWIKFGLLGQDIFKVREEVAREKDKELKEKGMIKEN